MNIATELQGQGKDVHNTLNAAFCKKVRAKIPDITDGQIKDIVTDFGKYMVENVTTYRDGVLLPSCLGHIFMGCFLNKDKKFKETVNVKRLEQDIELYNPEDHDGYDVRLFYSMNPVRKICGNVKYYGLLPGTDTKSVVRKAFNRSWKSYIVVPDLRFMSDLYKKNTKKVKRDTKDEKKLAEYDEFKFSITKTDNGSIEDRANVLPG